jgi:hypothetical protein
MTMAAGDRMYCLMVMGRLRGFDSNFYEGLSALVEHGQGPGCNVEVRNVEGDATATLENLNAGEGP